MTTKTSNPNVHKRIVSSLKRVPDSTWSLGIKHAIKMGGDAIWTVIQEMQKQNLEHSESMKNILGRSYGPIMKYKPRKKRIGNTTLRKLPGDVTEITNTKAPMHTDGLKRLLSSKKYSSFGQNQREVVKEGEQLVLRWVDFEDIQTGELFWYSAPNTIDVITGRTFKWLRKVDDVSAKNIKTEQLIKMLDNSQCLIPTKVNFSLTIKQTPGNTEVTTMATAKTAKKKAAKKPAAKKTSEKTLASKGKDAGTISNIIALHKEGKTNKEIIEKHGFNKSTVGIQVAKFKKGESNYK